MNQLSADCGTWKQLAHEAKKYPLLVESAEWLAQYEATPFLYHFCGPVLPFLTRSPERECPVETTRHLVKPHLVEVEQTKVGHLWNLLHNADRSLIALPASEGLSDLAFDKGWRIIHPNIGTHELRRYEERFTIGRMDGATFYTEYLEDEEMTDDSAEFFNGVIVPLYEAESNHGIDADEEEFDENFSSIEEPEEQNEEQ